MRKLDQKQYKNLLYAGLGCLAVFLVTLILTHILYTRAALRVGGGYETLEAQAVEKQVTGSAKGGRHYRIYGITPDGYGKPYRVKWELYCSVEPGENFVVYRYEGYYESTLPMLISAAAGAGYQILEGAEAIALGAAVICIGLGAVGLIRLRKRRRRRRG